VTWDLDTGKVINSQAYDGIDLRKFSKHSDWNGATLLKGQREEVQDERFG
jgi:hypothetical protein